MIQVRACVGGWGSLTAVMAVFMGPPAGAAAAEVSFKGKINVIIGTTPGGGTDGTTRLVGCYLEKYLPGKPKMIYRNMPAVGGFKTTNYFASVAKRDGTFWMGGDGDYIAAETLRRDVAKFDPRAFDFIGGISRGGTVVPLWKDKEANLSDKSKRPVIFGSQERDRFPGGVGDAGGRSAGLESNGRKRLSWY